MSTVSWLDWEASKKMFPLSPIYQNASSTLQCSFFDRTKKTVPPFNQNIYIPIPILKSTDTWDNLVEKRGAEIVALNKPLHVFISGGIDSTATLIALLNAGATQITAYSTKQTLLDLISTTTVPKIETVRIINTNFSAIISDIIAKDEIIVTGELTDQVMGAGIIFYYNQLNKTDSSDLSLIPTVIKWRSPLMSDQEITDMIEYFRPISEQCPFQIKTLQDYFWWMNFSCKWNYVNLRMFCNVDLTADQINTNIKHFFGTEDFALWGMDEGNHRTQKYRNGRYKDILLTYIEQSPYSAWLIDVQKTPSLENTSFPIKTLYRSDDFSQVKINLLDSNSTNQALIDQILKA